MYNNRLKNDNINKYQSGFQPGDFTTNLYNTLISSLDKLEISDLCFAKSLKLLIKCGTKVSYAIKILWNL